MKRPMKTLYRPPPREDGADEDDQPETPLSSAEVSEDSDESSEKDARLVNRAQKRPRVDPNPVQQEGNIEEEEEEEDDSEASSDAVLTDYDEEEEEDMEETTGEAGRQRAMKRPKRNIFVEEEAEVDDSDEEEEDFDEELEKEFIDEAQEAEALQPQIYRTVDKRRDEEDVDVEEVTKRLQERYGRGQYATVGEYRGDAERVPMQFLLPTARDPNLWTVKCKAGREREIAMSLMRKFLDYAGTAHALRIKSAFIRENLKGYVYVEARSMGDVQMAIDKINHVYGNKITIVPRDEMVDLLTIKTRGPSLKEGAWVRVLRGTYKGDLAKVVEVLDNHETVIIKLLPRLDYTPKDQREANNGRADGGDKRPKRKAAVRPAQRLFNHKDVDKADRTLSRVQGKWTWGNDTFDKDGFLEREVKLMALQTENITPTLEELSKFSAAAADEGEEQDAMLAAVSQQAAGMQVGKQFHPGDAVVITEGDLKNAQGTVLKVESNNVVLKMDDEALGEVFMEPSKVGKVFRLGDHVRVVRGKFKDDMGLITKIEDNAVTVFSDLTMQQVTVFTKDIQSMADVSITENQATAYKLHDFVQLGPNTMAVIIKVERDQYRVIDQNGAIRFVKAQEITQKRDTRRAVALDTDQNTIQVNDTVEVIAGEHANRRGTVLHLYRTYAFVHNNELIETSGVFLARTRTLRVVRVDGSQNGEPQARFTAPAAANNYRSNLALIHKAVVIAGGPYKGYHGIVKTINEKGARVELNTNAKVITVDRSQLALKEDIRGANRPRSRFDGGVTPMIGSKTPNVFSGAQTPNVYGGGGRTPAWDAGAKTPAWDAGAKTPAWDAGAKTPAWDAGAKTPAWDAGAKTPAAWDSGSKTPMHHVQQDISAPRYVPASDAPPVASSAWEAPEHEPEPDFVLPPDWLRIQLEVTFREPNLQGLVGRITNVFENGKSASIFIPDRNRTVTKASEQVEPAPPSKRDRCMLIAGDKVGQFGVLIGMESEDAIVKLDDGDDFSIEPFRSLCKVAKVEEEE